MKQAALYIVLFACSMSLLKPVVPYIKDTAAHLFWYSHHMATVHYENGKLHVHKEISKQNKTEENAPTQKKMQQQEDIYLTPVASLATIDLVPLPLYFSLNENIMHQCTNTDDHPPRL